MQGYAPHIIADWIEGRYFKGLKGSVRIDHILFDSRKLVFPDTTLFFALTNGRRNGHDYITDLYNRGVRAFVISEAAEQVKFPEADFIMVSDTLEALQKLAARHRSQFSYPVIGITGSNGKTIVKEWLNHLLSPDFRIVRSPKSYNSQIGVPLSIWLMEGGDQLGIFEAGISATGEMEKLERLIRPSIGIFTNIGDAHAEGFSSVDEKIREKLKLFSHSEILIYCRDHQKIQDVIESEGFGHKPPVFFTWGFHPASDIHIQSIEKKLRQTRIEAFHQGKNYSFSIPFTDSAAVENALHAHGGDVVPVSFPGYH